MHLGVRHSWVTLPQQPAKLLEVQGAVLVQVVLDEALLLLGHGEGCIAVVQANGDMSGAKVAATWDLLLGGVVVVSRPRCGQGRAGSRLVCPGDAVLLVPLVASGASCGRPPGQEIRQAAGASAQHGPLRGGALLGRVEALKDLLARNDGLRFRHNGRILLGLGFRCRGRWARLRTRLWRARLWRARLRRLLLDGYSHELPAALQKLRQGHLAVLVVIHLFEDLLSLGTGHVTVILGDPLVELFKV
mmetsp:Transcript_85475/g.204854  ORF Transcript_85475/g.204854 Transcript_85475/m.204854 type:complete len:246 (+) Transcript_85475:484-1221(+)